MTEKTIKIIIITFDLQRERRQDLDEKILCCKRRIARREMYASVAVETSKNTGVTRIIVDVDKCKKPEIIIR